MVLFKDMALSAKLNQLSRQIVNQQEAEKQPIKDVALEEKIKTSEDKKHKEKKAKKEQMEALRLQTKELEEKIQALELLKNELTETENFVKNVQQNLSLKTQSLSTILNDPNNEAYLKQANIKTVENLINHEPLAEDEDVLAFKVAQEEVDSIKQKNLTLQDKLHTMGVKLSNFSYDHARKAIEEKVKHLEVELLRQERSKRPETRAHALEDLTETLEKSIPLIFLEKRDTSYVISFGMAGKKQNSEIILSGDKTAFKEWQVLKCVPEEAKVLQEKYGQELVDEVLNRAYEKNIEKAFEEFDQRIDNSNECLKEIQRADPDKAVEAHSALRKFNDSIPDFVEKIEAKRKELQNQGIKVDSDYYGLFKDMMSLTEFGHGDEKIRTTLNDPSRFPPEFDWQLLKEKIEKRKAQNDAFEKAFLAISSQQEADHFAKWEGKISDEREEGTVGRFFQDFSREAKFSGYHSIPDGAIDPRFKSQNIKQKLPQGLNDYYEVKRYFEDKKKVLNSVKEKVREKFFLGFQAKILKDQLEQEIKKDNFASHIDAIETKVENIKNSKEEASNVMEQLLSLEARLPEGEVSLNGTRITVLSVQQEMKDFMQGKKNAEEDQREAESGIRNLGERPNFFGKKEWDVSLEELNRKKEKAKREILEKSDYEYGELQKKCYFDIKVSADRGYTQGYTDVSSLVRGVYNPKANSDEVFAGLKKQLAEIINRKPPEKVITLYSEYQKIVSKLAA
jgi:hypothetical protein